MRVRVTRADLRSELLAAAHTALEAARAAHADAVAGATHAEARAENDKDTRGLEQSYLARGHALRVEELEAALVQIARLPGERPGPRVGLGAVVTVDDDGTESRYFVAPWGGGVILAGGVPAVTPQAPIGRALVGRAVDDEVELKRPGGVREVTIVSID